MLAAPFSGGGSLLLTAASTGFSIGGSVKGYLSDKDMQNKIAKIVNDLNACKDEMYEAENQLQCELQNVETLLDFFKESGIHEQIIKIANNLEHNEDVGHALSAAKPIIDCCKSAAMFKSVLTSQGSTRLVTNIMTIRFVLRKTKTFARYIPEVMSLSRGTLRHGVFPMTSAQTVIRVGPDSFIMRVPVMKSVDAGKQIVSKSATITTGKEIASKSTIITAGKEVATNSATISAGKEFATKSVTVTAGNQIATKSTTFIAGKEIAKKTTVVTATAGKEITKVTGEKVVVHGLAKNTEVIGKNFVANTKDVNIVGSIQKSTDTLTKTAGSISKLGVGISAIAIAFDTYSLIKAFSASQKRHPTSEYLRKKSIEIRAMVKQLDDIYRDLTLLHNELLSIFTETERGSDEFDSDEVGNDAIEDDGDDDINLGSDDVENIRTYLEKSQIVLG